MKPAEDEPQKEPARTLYKEETDPEYQPQQVWAEEKTVSSAGEAGDFRAESPAVNVQNESPAPGIESRLNPPPPKYGSRESAGQRTPRTGREQSQYKCDISKLDGLLSNNFEAYQPFKRPSRGYSWYRVSDLAKLSNIMYMSGINVPLFANPKILVGLFKFKHILAGLYRGDNGAQYYVIGVPARDDKDNKPFENACKWVPVSESEIRDMGGYWLVYVSLK